MTDEQKRELRVKVAEAMGWTDIQTTGDLPGQIQGIPRKGHYYKPAPSPDELDPRQFYWLPRWEEDLNACFEFEEWLLLNEENHDKAYKYDMNLLRISGAIDEETGLLKTCLLWHATATQRAQAFVKVMEGKA